MENIKLHWLLVREYLIGNNIDGWIYLLFYLFGLILMATQISSTFGFLGTLFLFVILYSVFYDIYYEKKTRIEVLESRNNALELENSRLQERVAHLDSLFGGLEKILSSQNLSETGNVMKDVTPNSEL